MGFSTYSTQNHQFKILPTAFLSKPPNIMFTNNSAYIYGIHLPATLLLHAFSINEFHAKTEVFNHIEENLKISILWH